MSSTIIDHAIAIPTKQRNVWEYVSDITNFPLWREDIQSIAYLTGKHEGRGTRFRTTSKRGAEQVIEITAWYEGLGYEYIIVDGTSFANNRGRLRLQESTEGTIVQWTFSYELTGFLSGLRNSLSVRRSLDNNITNNLRNLYTYIKDVRGEERFVAEDAKSYLQEAPDVLARSQYQPRYPTQSETGMPAVPDALPVSDHSRFEPPIAEDDTKPNPSIQETSETDFKPIEQIEPTSGVEPLPEPTFLKDVPDINQTTQPQVRAESLPLLGEQEIETESITAPAPTPAENTNIWLPETNDQTPLSEPDVSESLAAESTEPEAINEDEADAVYTASLGGLPDTTALDTSRMSIFEVFGLPKPSETENTRTIQTTPPIDLSQEPLVIEANTQQIKAFTDSEPIVPDVEPDTAPKRTGLRASLRRKQTRVRLPK